MVLIALIGISLSIANKKNKAKAQQQRQAIQGKDAAGPKTAASQSAANRTSPAKPSAAPSKFPSAGPSKYPPASPSRRPAGTPQKPQTKSTAPSYGGTPRYSHVVQSTLEGGHTHTESSLTGEEPCPPPKAVAQKQPETGKSPAVNTGESPLLTFQTNSVLQGVLYSEILGKPKALQRN